MRYRGSLSFLFSLCLQSLRAVWELGGRETGGGRKENENENKNLFFFNRSLSLARSLLSSLSSLFSPIKFQLFFLSVFLQTISTPGTFPRDSLRALGSLPRIGLSLTPEEDFAGAAGAAAGAALLLPPSPPLFAPAAAAAAGGELAAAAAAAIPPVQACTSSTGGIRASTCDVSSHAMVCPRDR